MSSAPIESNTTKPIVNPYQHVGSLAICEDEDEDEDEGQQFLVKGKNKFRWTEYFSFLAVGLSMMWTW